MTTTKLDPEMSSDSDDKYFVPKASPRAFGNDIDMGEVEFSDFVGGSEISTDIFQLGCPTSLPDTPIASDHSSKVTPRKYSLSDFADRLFRHQNHLEEEAGRKSSQPHPRIAGLKHLLNQIYRLRQNTDTSDNTECSTSDVPNKTRKSVNTAFQRSRLLAKDVEELHMLVSSLTDQVRKTACGLVKQLKLRDRLATRRDKQYDVITAFIQALSEKRRQDTRMKFSVGPLPGDSGFAQWHDAMKMVSRLPGGIPNEFRRTLWLTLAEQHLQRRQVNWKQIENYCFNEWSNPDDDELGAQIVKDLHRTGCSSFCGENAEHNQFLLKKVLLAYARWNKVIGYCQGFNMLAALILEVMDKKEGDSLKVMIYLIEGLLPEGYFTQSLKGLSVDMAVFRDLLRLRLPNLSQHLDLLQHDARDNTSGTSYEPPLTNVFTMQWFLTMFCTCLPQSTVLRVWDLVFLEGNEVLLRTALAIWDGLADRIMGVDSADEFYCIMGVLTREMLEFGLMNANRLVETIVQMAPFPFPGLGEIRDKYTYNITPWTQSVSTVAKRGLRLFYSDDDEEEDDDEKIAVAAALSAVFRSKASSPQTNYPRHDRLNLDISALKKQYSKLRERQRQTHVVLTGSGRLSDDNSSKPAQTIMNHLLLGRKPLKRHSISNNPHAPPPGPTIIPQVKPYLQNRKGSLKKNSVTKSTKPKTMPEREQYPIKQTFVEIQVLTNNTVVEKSAKVESGETLHWKDMKKDIKTSKSSDKEVRFIDKVENEDNKSTGTSTSTELCDDDLGHLSDLEDEIDVINSSSHSKPQDSTLNEHPSADHHSSSDLLFALDLQLLPNTSDNEQVEKTVPSDCTLDGELNEDLAQHLLQMRAQLENIFGEKLRSSSLEFDESPPKYRNWKDNPNYKWLFHCSEEGDLSLDIPTDTNIVDDSFQQKVEETVISDQPCVDNSLKDNNDLIDFGKEEHVNAVLPHPAVSQIETNEVTTGNSQTKSDSQLTESFADFDNVFSNGEENGLASPELRSCLKVELEDSRISFLEVTTNGEEGSSNSSFLPIQGTFMCQPLNPVTDVTNLSCVISEPAELEETSIESVCTKEFLIFPESGSSIEVTSLILTPNNETKPVPKTSDIENVSHSDIIDGDTERPFLMTLRELSSRSQVCSSNLKASSDNTESNITRTCSESDIYKNLILEENDVIENSEQNSRKTFAGPMDGFMKESTSYDTSIKPFYLVKKPEETSTIDACRKFLKRRNSEKALRIIQENLEIMGKIQKQPSVRPIEECHKVDGNKVSDIDQTPSSDCSNTEFTVTEQPISKSLDDVERVLPFPTTAATQRHRTQSLQSSVGIPHILADSLQSLQINKNKSGLSKSSVKGFCPFPPRQTQHKDVGIKLGLYSKNGSQASK